MQFYMTGKDLRDRVNRLALETYIWSKHLTDYNCYIQARKTTKVTKKVVKANKKWTQEEIQASKTLVRKVVRYVETYRDTYCNSPQEEKIGTVSAYICMQQQPHTSLIPPTTIIVLSFLTWMQNTTTTATTSQQQQQKQKLVKKWQGAHLAAAPLPLARQTVTSRRIHISMSTSGRLFRSKTRHEWFMGHVNGSITALGTWLWRKVWTDYVVFIVVCVFLYYSQILLLVLQSTAMTGARPRIISQMGWVILIVIYFFICVTHTSLSIL